MYVPIWFQISEIFAAYLALQSMGISSASTALQTEYVTTLTGKHPKHEQHSLPTVTLHMITYPVLDMLASHPSPTENRLGFLGPPRPTWCFHGLMIALAMCAALAMLVDIKCLTNLFLSWSFYSKHSILGLKPFKFLARTTIQSSYINSHKQTDEGIVQDQCMHAFIWRTILANTMEINSKQKPKQSYL